MTAFSATLINIALITAILVSKPFSRIHPNLTLDRVTTEKVFDLRISDLQDRAHPAADLDGIYRMEGLYYDKTRLATERTVAALDYSRLYLEIPNVIPDLKKFTDHITEFLS